MKRRECGYSLLELVATLSVIAVLVMGAIPLAENSLKRQKEMRLRETLRDIREAIDEFHRDTMGACIGGADGVPGNPAAASIGGAQGNVPTDPRSRVVVSDCKIFETDNMDRYPPTLETLTDGVTVKSRGVSMQGGSGISDGTKQATEINSNKELKKIYLRELPIDPMTGKTDWVMRSSYQDKDSDSWDSINVFDIRSSSDDEALDGTKYKDW